MIGPKRLDEAAEQGGREFWRLMQEMFPEISEDDIDPGAVMALEIQMRAGLERVLQRTTERTEEDTGPSPTFYVRRK